jgi:hypothetical protein
MSSSEQDRQTSETTPTATTKFSRPIGIVLGAVGVVLALIAVDVVLINGIQPAQARPITQVVKARSQGGAVPVFRGMPCDPYSMAHDGYMRGFITAS